MQLMNITPELKQNTTNNINQELNEYQVMTPEVTRGCQNSKNGAQSISAWQFYQAIVPDLSVKQAGTTPSSPKNSHLQRQSFEKNNNSVLKQSVNKKQSNGKQKNLLELLRSRMSGYDFDNYRNDSNNSPVRV